MACVLIRVYAYACLGFVRTFSSPTLSFKSKFTRLGLQVTLLGNEGLSPKVSTPPETRDFSLVVVVRWQTVRGGDLVYKFWVRQKMKL